MKRKFNPDQRLLGNWVDGLVEGTSESLIEEQMKKQAEEQERLQAMMPERSAPSEDAGLSFNDLALRIVDIMQNLKGSKILVCPMCHGDLEPHFSKPPDTQSQNGEMRCRYNLEAQNELSVFCRCPSCEVKFFIFEIVHQKSYRLKRQSDQNTTLYAQSGGQFYKFTNGYSYEEVEN
jgi:uncharacterized protein YbaR (Trm112 family)